LREDIEKTIRLARHFGISSLAIESDQNTLKIARELGKSLGVKIYSRANIYGGSLKELKRNVGKVKADVKAVICTSTRIAREAAKIRGVLLSFPGDKAWLIDRRQINVVSQLGGFLEITYSPILTSPNRYVIAALKKAVHVALKGGVPLIISSGAKKPRDLRSPRDFLGLVVSMGYGWEKVLPMASKYPMRYVEGGLLEG